MLPYDARHPRFQVRRSYNGCMDLTENLALSTGLAWASGVRLYAVLFFAGCLADLGYVELPAHLHILMHPAVLTASGFMFCVEFFADKVPGFDSLWDAVHTFIRIPAGALLAALALAGQDPALVLAAAIVGGTLTSLSHLTKAGSRALINASPEPFSNWAASFSEEAMVFSGLWLALSYPLAFLVGMAIFVLGALWLLPKLWCGLRQAWRLLRAVPPPPRG